MFVQNRLVTDFSSGSSKSGFRPFFVNPAKSVSSHSSNQICLMLVQLQYIQLITDKTNTADLSNGVFSMLIGVTEEKNTKSLAVPQIWSKTGKHWRDKGSTELHCLFIADDALVYCSMIQKLVLPKSGSGFGSGWIWVPKSGQVQLRLDLK